MRSVEFTRTEVRKTTVQAGQEADVLEDAALRLQRLIDGSSSAAAAPSLRHTCIHPFAFPASSAGAAAIGCSGAGLRPPPAPGRCHRRCSNQRSSLCRQRRGGSDRLLNLQLSNLMRFSRSGTVASAGPQRRRCCRLLSSKLRFASAAGTFWLRRANLHVFLQQLHT